MNKNVEISRTPKSFYFHFLFFYFFFRRLVLKCLLGKLIQAWFKWSGTKSPEKKHESFRRPPCNYSVLSFRGSCIIIMEIKSNTHTNIYLIYTHAYFLYFFFFSRSCVVVWLPIIGHIFTLVFFFYVNSRGSLLVRLVTIPRWWFLNPYVCFFFFLSGVDKLINRNYW